VLSCLSPLTDRSLQHCSIACWPSSLGIAQSLPIANSPSQLCATPQPQDRLDRCVAQLGWRPHIDDKLSLQAPHQFRTARVDVMLCDKKPCFLWNSTCVIGHPPSLVEWSLIAVHCCTLCDWHTLVVGHMVTLCWPLWHSLTVGLLKNWSLPHSISDTVAVPLALAHRGAQLGYTLGTAWLHPGYTLVTPWLPYLSCGTIAPPCAWC